MHMIAKHGEMKTVIQSKKFPPTNVFHIDIIYRQRKQYLHIQELTLKSYYLNEQ